ncbi:prolyl aminopeptidase-like protein [Tricladium varicosporioides]|nr:prolyl aminopeptidase-like protein [Hymenoscyphus varicosporioides]
MASSTKAEIILVPGAWHSPDSFGPTTAILEKAGYTVHGVDLAASAGPPYITSFQPDVNLIWAATEKVLSQGKDVVHVYHSYGSVPGMESLKECIDGEEKEGWGRVKRLVFICAFVLDVEGSLMKALGGKDLPWFQVSEDKQLVTPANPHNIFYNDLTNSQSKPHIDVLKPHAYQTFNSELTVAPWKNIPCTYVLCEDDRAIPIQAQEGMVAMANRAKEGAFDVIERCTASHSPFLSQSEWLAKVLENAVGGN